MMRNGLANSASSSVPGEHLGEELAAEGTKDVGWLIVQAERTFDCGAGIIMIGSEGITENVTTWRSDVVAAGP